MQHHTTEHPRSELVVELIERYAEARAADPASIAWATGQGREALRRGQSEAEAVKHGEDQLDCLLEQFRRTDALPGTDVSCRVLSPATEHEDIHVESMDYQGAPDENTHRLSLTIYHIPTGQRRILTCEPARADVVAFDAAVRSADMEMQA